jgi:hypothetical protein
MEKNKKNFFYIAKEAIQGSPLVKPLPFYCHTGYFDEVLFLFIFDVITSKKRSQLI